jgi:hypothetical protein
MKIGNRKGEETLLSRGDVDYPAIMYIDEDWKQKKEGGTLISRCDVDLSSDYVH